MSLEQTLQFIFIKEYLVEVGRWYRRKVYQPEESFILIRT